MVSILIDVLTKKQAEGACRKSIKKTPDIDFPAGKRIAGVIMLQPVCLLVYWFRV